MEWHFYFIFGLVYVYLFFFMVRRKHDDASSESWTVIMNRTFEEAGKEIREMREDEYQGQLLEGWYAENLRARETLAYSSYYLWVEAIHGIRRK